MTSDNNSPGADQTSQRRTVKELIYKFFETPLWRTVVQSFMILFFTVLPLIVEWLYNWGYNKDNDHFNQGQFITYSISLLSSSIVTWICMEKRRNVFKTTMNGISIPFLCGLGIVYGMITVNPEKPNHHFIYTLSIFSFIAALVIFFHSQYVSNKQPVDVGEISRNQTENITNSIS